jgi:tetratricopeptide (TPR) repeat protein
MAKNTEYRLPVKLSKDIESFAIRFELANLSRKPMIEAKGLGNFKLNEWNSGFFAEKEISGKDLETEIRLSIPASESGKVFTQTGSDGNTYFVIQDKVSPDSDLSSGASIKTVAIFYDASNSFSASRKEKEKSFLKSFFKKFSDIKAVKLIEFRNKVSKVNTFEDGQATANSVISAIDAVQYDGGTSFASLKLPEGFSPDVVLLFSDGLQSFGKDTPARITAPVYSVVSSDGADFPFLRNISAGSGGLLLNLNRFPAAKLINKIGKKVFAFLPDSSYAGIEELYPARPTAIQGDFFAAGILEAGQTEVKLKFGINGQSQVERTYQIKSNNYEGDLLRKFWAGKKIDFLAALAEKNKPQIISTSKKHSVLSQFTSMIVLERPEQYIEHEIIPPKSKPEWRKNYFDVLEKRAAKDKAFKDSKLEQVVGMWKKRIEWWKKDYDISPDFRISAGRKKKSRARNGGGLMREAAADSFDGEPQSLTSAVRPSPSIQSDEIAADEAMIGAAAPQEEAKMMSKEDESKPSRRNVEPGVAIKAWDPKTPYTKRIKKAKESMRFAQYLEEKKEYGTSPAFYLDCSDIFRKDGKKELALQILSNIAELELENSALVRILAHRLAQLEELELSALLFEEVLKMREEEPQSYRDLALVYGRLGKFKKAVELLYEVVLKKWDGRFPEIEVIVLEEMNNLIAKGKRQGVEDFNVDSRLVKLLDVDLRIVMTWDADMTDMDLWVIEPSNEKAYYSNPRSHIGGLVSRDFTRGYGPEEYMIKKAMRGMYKIQTNFFGSSQQKIAGAVTLQVDVFSNYGRKNEKRKSTTIRLKENKQTFTVADIEF